MWEVSVYIGTSLHGQAKGPGRVAYVIQTRKKDGSLHERKAVTELAAASEGRLVLYALRDALGRFSLASEITVYTECTHVAAALNNCWAAGWKENGWKTSRGKPVKEAGLWRDILWEWEDTGHRISAVCGKHAFSSWMAWNMGKILTNQDYFLDIGEDPGEQVTVLPEEYP